MQQQGIRQISSRGAQVWPALLCVRLLLMPPSLCSALARIVPPPMLPLLLTLLLLLQLLLLGMLLPQPQRQR